jgi:glutamyl-tRNA reductase
MKLVCGGLNFESASVQVREKAAFPPERLAEVLPALKNQLRLEEAVLLSTCNRVEYFGLARRTENLEPAWPQFLRAAHGFSDDLAPVSFHYADEACVDHLFQMAAGLKSMVIGETEIFGQVKEAYEASQRLGLTGKWMHRLFQSSFAAAKEVRSRTAITRGSVSVGSVAVDLAEKIFGQLQGCQAMILGAGLTSEKTARALRSRGVGAVLVANRTFSHAQDLARELSGRAVRWEEWAEQAVTADIMIGSTAAPHYVVTVEKLAPVMARRAGRPLFLIDLAVPRDIAPEVAMLPNVFLFDIDDLQAISRRNAELRGAEIQQGREILRPHAQRFTAWVERQQKLFSSPLELLS